MTSGNGGVSARPHADVLLLIEVLFAMWSNH